MGIWTFICNGVKGLASLLGLIEQRSAAANTPQMKANATAKTDQGMADQAAKDVAKAAQGDPKALEEDIS